MRTLALFLLATAWNICWAQKESPTLPINKETGKIIYTEVVSVDSSLNRGKLYNNAKEWFTKIYKSSKEVIQLDDKEKGIIIGKGIIPVYYQYLGTSTQDGYINYTISVIVKDGRFKYEITDFYHEPHLIGGNNYGTAEEMMNTNKLGYQKILNKMLFQMDTSINELILNLKTSIGKIDTSDSW